MYTSDAKEHPLSLRLASADVALIDRAAKMKGRSRTEFMRDAAVREAEEVVMDNLLVRMSEAGFKSFVEAIEAPVEVNEKLRTTLQRKSQWDAS
jgi:uncharacterized protein (DUF1778 family)